MDLYKYLYKKKHIPSGWEDFFNQDSIKSELKEISAQIDKEIVELDRIIYPERKNVFHAFRRTPLDEIKVVILGQDPYHSNEGEAMGLSFSVPKNYKLPPSLKNIYKELIAEGLLEKMPDSGCLKPWADQGIFMLNTALTVISKKPNSHSVHWKLFTEDLLIYLNEHCKPGTIFVLWGKHAQNYEVHIDEGIHTVLKSPHPSPFSARTGFFGNGHFAKINQILESTDREPIDWTIS